MGAPTFPRPPSPQSAGASTPAAGPKWGLGDVATGLLLYFAVMVAGGAFVVGVLAGVLGESGTDSATLGGNWPLVFLVPLSVVPLVGWPWWVSRHKGSGSMAHDFGLAFRGTDALVGVGAGLAALGLSVGLALVFAAVAGEPPPTNTEGFEGIDISPLLFVVTIGLVGVVTPFAEEVFFRGLVLGAARKAWGVPVGVAFSSVLFGLIHIQDTALGWAYVGTITALYGVVFALTRLWTDGRIAAAIIAHMVVNTVALVVVFVS